MRIPAAIYPFSAELLPAVKYFERLQDRYTLTKLISLPGFGLGGKDAAYACNQPETGFLVTEELWGGGPVVGNPIGLPALATGEISP